LPFESVASGFYGKIPSRGDFLQKGLPRDFVSAWDAWLAASVARSREALGPRWTEAFMTAPFWRFHLAPGLCGEAAACGVMLPSVDRVGREFPLVLARVGAVPLGDAVSSRASGWFAAVEHLALDLLDHLLEPDVIADRLVELDTLFPLPGGYRQGGWRCAPGSLDSPFRSLPVEDLARFGIAGPAELGAWWSGGSDLVEPSELWCRGMPPPDGFAALLVGEWDGFGWGQAAPGEVV
jgi:type VI secretion system protein ImpM